MSAWGDSWGTSWGDSWGPVAAPSPSSGGRGPKVGARELWQMVHAIEAERRLVSLIQQQHRQRLIRAMWQTRVTEEVQRGAQVLSAVQEQAAVATVAAVLSEV